MVLDMGNTFTKIAFFESNTLIWFKKYRSINEKTLSGLIKKFSPDNGIISSVAKANASLSTLLAQSLKLIHFQHDVVKSIKNHYLTPHTLGLDRLAGIVGAYHIYPAQNNLVIDAGTCITYDCIDHSGNYFGGSISPGLHMRYQSLKHFTRRLPLLEVDMDFDLKEGRNTAEAIHSGVLNGLRYELTGFIEAYKQQHPDMNIILTGGDGNFFDTLLKNSIFAPYLKSEPHLVLKGLNAIIHQHND